MAGLPEPHRAVIALRYGLDEEPLTVEMVRRRLHISREKVMKLEAEGLAKLAGEIVSKQVGPADQARFVTEFVSQARSGAGRTTGGSR